MEFQEIGFTFVETNKESLLLGLLQSRLFIFLHAYFNNKNTTIMGQINHITAAGLEKLRNDLETLKANRPHLSAQIAEARDKGDLSENAEYDAAKEAQGLLEMRIAKLEQSLANARVLDPSKIDTKSVQILNYVSVRNLTTNKDAKYMLVSENEANIKEGKLSVGTPIAKALLGKKRGDVVEVTVPSGTMKLEILDITLD